MNVIDVIYALATLLALVFGYREGFIKKVSSIVGIVFGLFNATVLHESASTIIFKYTGWDEVVVSVSAYVIVFILSVIIIKLVAGLLTWLLELLGLQIVNRLAGALLSAFIMMIIVTAIIDVSAMVAPENKFTGKTTQEQSLLYDKVVNGIYKKTLTRLF
ncbi:MAG: CvpA family protein [Bacteroidaceae bacterium]|nr:CvpA family protein [Bacteroidaceae bacterium]